MSFSYQPLRRARLTLLYQLFEIVFKLFRLFFDHGAILIYGSPADF